MCEVKNLMDPINNLKKLINLKKRLNYPFLYPYILYKKILYGEVIKEFADKNVRENYYQDVLSN